MIGFHLNGSYVPIIAKKIVSNNVWILFEPLTHVMQIEEQICPTVTDAADRTNNNYLQNLKHIINFPDQ